MTIRNLLAVFCVSVMALQAQAEEQWFIKASSRVSGVERNEKGQVVVKLRTLVEGRNEIHSVSEKPTILSLEADGKPVELPKAKAISVLPGDAAKQDHVLVFDGVPANAKTISFKFKVSGSVWDSPGKLDIPVGSKKTFDAGCVKLRLESIEKGTDGHYAARLYIGTTRTYEVPAFTLVDENGRSYEVESYGAVDAEKGMSMTVKFKKDDRQGAPSKVHVEHKGEPIEGNLSMSYKGLQIFDNR
jgi:hypothetical protein